MLTDGVTTAGDDLPKAAREASRAGVPLYLVGVGDVWETPDTVQTLLSYPDKQVQVYFEGTFSNNRNGSMVEFMGTEGTLYVDRMQTRTLTTV